ncbi:MAG: hypothetical protein JSV84_06605 [Gemmatimonadota bacterium]|nr:MAG: hypothetical protein JSV84_06605 [Gemmatimonadota bacterium]
MGIDLIKPLIARDIEKNTKHFRLTKRIVSGINFALTIGGILFSRRASIEFEDYEKALFFNSDPSTYVESNVDRSNVFIISGTETSFIPSALNFFLFPAIILIRGTMPIISIKNTCSPGRRIVSSVRLFI